MRVDVATDNGPRCLAVHFDRALNREWSCQGTIYTYELHHPLPYRDDNTGRIHRRAWIANVTCVICHDLWTIELGMSEPTTVREVVEAHTRQVAR